MSIFTRKCGEKKEMDEIINIGKSERKRLRKGQQKKQREIYRELESEGSNLRGKILDRTIMVEKSIENFLEAYFIQEKLKRNLFLTEILQKEFFTFEQKIRVLGKIYLDTFFLNLRDSKGIIYPLSSNKKEFFKTMRYIQRIRNVLAHNPLSLDTLNNKIIVCYRYDKKDEQLNLNKYFLREFLNKCDEVISILANITLKLYNPI